MRVIIHSFSSMLICPGWRGLKCILSNLNIILIGGRDFQKCIFHNSECLSSSGLSGVGVGGQGIVRSYNQMY